eukprot:10267673-Karenia_brevis.AAC.1
MTQARLKEFTAQELVNAVWVFAKACCESSLLIDVMAYSVKAWLKSVNSQNLANTEWALPRLAMHHLYSLMRLQKWRRPTAGLQISGPGEHSVSFCLSRKRFANTSLRTQSW